MAPKTPLSDERIQDLFNIVSDNLKAYRKIPVATYRLQLNHQFKFSDARAIVSYLHELGISDCYASPYFKARKGSLHGYDILDPNALNPEIGSKEDYREFMAELKMYGMGQVLDIVPNHMGIGGNENVWWMDVLENGPSSQYASFFDIDWKPVKDELENKVLLPLLGDQYGRVLENQELTLAFEEGAFFIHYHDRKLPLAPLSYLKVLHFRIDELEKKAGKDHPHFQEFLSILTAISHLPPRTEKEPGKVLERRREKEIIKKRLEDLSAKSRDVRIHVTETLRMFNGEKGKPRSFDTLDELLNDQVYRLAHWQVATEEINYRRFFDVNELAAIRMENPPVFKETHQLIFKLIRKEYVTGLRVDHPDGLYDPAAYFSRLQRGCFIQFCLRHLPSLPETSDLEERLNRIYDEKASGESSSSLRKPFYIVGEKILMKSERIPEDWPIFSTTGYVFLNAVNGIFIQMGHAKVFEDIYRRYTKAKIDYPDLVYEKKKLIIQTSMPSEINMLGHYLNRISEKNRHTRDFTLNNLTSAIVEVIANFPVYRTYMTRSGVTDRDRRYVEQAVSRAKRKNPALSATVFDFLKNVLWLEYPEHFTETDKLEWQDFVMRFQQMTGPIMAKGVEDTAFYVYNRFIGLNEVGGNPERFGTSLETFHGMNIERSKYWPDAMITTETHDTKRSEDVRARLNVLSEIPEEWREHLFRWSRINKKRKTVIDGQWIPDRNDEYLLYQTLLGTWPLHPMKKKWNEHFKGRIKEYMLKAAREAKIHTSWISPNLPYEEAVLTFIDAILLDSPGNLFLRDFEIFQDKISYLGMFNSLGQTLLKITSPGIPDFYQGTEIWNFSLVDPDNRKPVDFHLRKKLLADLKKGIEGSGADLKAFAKNLIQGWKEGAPKLYVTFKALNYRRENYSIFREGAYVPLEGDGNLREHVCAFARQRKEKAVLIAVPRFLFRLGINNEVLPIGEPVWGGTGIILEEISGHEFRNIFTGERMKRVHHNGKDLLPLSEVFAHFPVAMLEQV